MHSAEVSIASDWSLLLIPAGLTLLAGAILINFLRYQPEEERQTFQYSMVDTLSMGLFAMAAIVVVTLKWGTYDAGQLETMLRMIGVLLFYGSIVLNLLGRKWLGSNWSDQIRIRENHQLIQTGAYQYIRHPLYSSTIGMLIGAGLVYSNGFVLIATVLFFVPMMVYRTLQEERHLKRCFPEYEAYCLHTGMFLPKIHKRRLP